MGESGQNSTTKQPFILSVSKSILIIISVGIIVFFLMLFNSFVWDDFIQIVQNTDIASIRNIPRLFLSGQLGVFYRPVFYSILAILYSLFKLNPFYYHAFQLILHLSNTVLIFLFFKRIFKKRLSLLLSLMFLVHPINVEAVVYISAVSDTLFVFFGLLALFLVTKTKENIFDVLLASLLVLLSMLTKEAGVLFLVIILLYRLFFNRKNPLWTVIFAAIPLIFYSFLRFFVANTYFSGVNFVPIAEASLVDRLLTIPKIIFFYLSTFVIPIRLSIAQEWVVRAASFGDFFVPLIVDIGVMIALVWMGTYIIKTQKKDFLLYVFFMLWFLIGLSIYLQVIPLDMTVAERWFYFPIIGLLGVVGLFLTKTPFIYKQKDKVIVILVFILVIFSLRSIVRSISWYDGYTLYSHDEKINNDNYLLKHNLAVELAKKGNYDEALKYDEESIHLNPDWGMSWALTGTIYYYRKDISKTNYYLTEALKRDGGIYGAFFYLGKSYIYTKDYISAENWIRQGLRSFPDNWQLTELLTIAEYLQGNQVEAQELVQKLIKLYPSARTRTLYNSIYNKQQLPTELFIN
jgi:hypothetical protein